MPSFAVTTVAGPHWAPALGIREQVGWAEHGLFLDDLVERGVVLLGGPIGLSDIRSRGEAVARLAVVADDPDAIHAMFADDPWVRDGIIVLGTIEPWRLWLRPR